MQAKIAMPEKRRQLLMKILTDYVVLNRLTDSEMQEYVNILRDVGIACVDPSSTAPPNAGVVSREREMLKKFDQGSRDRAMLKRLNELGWIENGPDGARLSEVGLYWLPREGETHGPRQHGWPVGTRICDCVTGEVEPQPCHCERATGAK